MDAEHLLFNSGAVDHECQIVLQAFSRLLTDADVEFTPDHRRNVPVKLHAALPHRTPDHHLSFGEDGDLRRICADVHNHMARRAEHRQSHRDGIRHGLVDQMNLSRAECGIHHIVEGSLLYRRDLRGNREADPRALL